MFYVYRHIRTDKNIPFYIGIGKKIENEEYKRAHEKARRSIFWKRVVSKTTYEVEIIMDVSTKEEAINKEIEFIKLYGRSNLGQGPLVNLTDGGNYTVGMVHSQESRKKISLALTGRKRIFSEQAKQNIRASNLSRDKSKINYNHSPLSKEHKDKLSIKMKGNKHGLGKKLSDKRKAEISALHKGHKYNLGKKHTSEHKRKISESNQGRIISDTHREKLSLRNKGNKYSVGCVRSEEAKMKLRILKTGNQYTKGRKHTEESKIKMSKVQKELAKKRVYSEETLKKMSAAQKGKRQSRETIEKRKASMVGHIQPKHTEVTKAKMRLAWERRKLNKT